ncbi:MAG: hypothetical protein AAF696_14695 [Bacteroidota bacterium]
MRIFCYPCLLIILLFPAFLFSQELAPEKKTAKKLKLAPIPTKEIFVGRQLNIQLQATSPAISELSYEFSWTRGGSMDEESGLFSWKPDIEDIGNHPIIFTVIDNLTQEQTSQPAIISVKAPQYRPVLSLTSRTDLTGKLIGLKEGENFALVIEGLDKNKNDKLKLSYYVDLEPEKQLENAYFQVNDRVATFLWTPNNAQAQKKNFSLSFRVEDNRGLASEKNLYFMIEDVEHPPIFQNPTRAYVFGEDKSSSFQVKAIDEDEEKIIYGIQSGDIRSGDYSFDPNTGKFQWKPGFAYARSAESYPLIFSASDGTFTTYDTIMVKVAANNYPPSIAQLRNQEIYENEELLITLDVQDRNGLEDIELTLVNDGGLNGYEFVPEERKFSWKPAFDFVKQQGSKKEVRLKFRVSDGELSNEQSLNITVLDRDDPEETQKTYSQSLKTAKDIYSKLSRIENHLGQVIKKKRNWNTFFDVSTIAVGVFTGIASSNIASEGLQNASVPIGAAATSLIGIRNIANKSLDKIVNLKAQVISLTGKIQLSINGMEGKFGKEPSFAVVEQDDFKRELRELVDKVEKYEEERVNIMAIYANLPIKSLDAPKKSGGLFKKKS